MTAFQVILTNKDIICAAEQELEHHPDLEPVDLYKLCYQAWFGPAHITSDQDLVSASIITEVQNMEYDYYPLWQDIGNKSGFSRLSLSWLNKLDSDSCAIKAGALAKLMLLSAPLGRKDLSMKHLWHTVAPLFMELLPADPQAWEEVNTIAANEQMPHHSKRYTSLYHPHYRVIHPSINDLILNIIS